MPGIGSTQDPTDARRLTTDEMRRSARIVADAVVDSLIKALEELPRVSFPREDMLGVIMVGVHAAINYIDQGAAEKPIFDIRIESFASEAQTEEQAATNR